MTKSIDGLGGGRQGTHSKIFYIRDGLLMALVVCNRHNECGYMVCPWYNPRQEVEVGHAYCKHYAAQTDGKTGVNNIRIMQVSELYPLDEDNPNTAFKRKKHGF